MRAVAEKQQGRLKAVEPGRMLGLADLFRVLGDLTRVRILHTLGEGERCVGDLSESLGLSQSAVSHQLQLLRLARRVRQRRAGKHVFYALDDEHVKGLMDLGLEHLAE